jgi:diguanylate cyclase (GGDEF)-like protein
VVAEARASGHLPEPGAGLLAVAFEEAPIGLLLVVREGNHLGEVLEANAAAVALLGCSASPVGRDLATILGGTGLLVGDRGLRHLVTPSHGDDRRWVAATASALSEQAWVQGRPTALVALHDVTEQHDAQERLNRAARHDPLTGLINRGELLRMLGSVDPVDDGPLVAVIYLDLDGFKLVNDTRGHGAGDELLVAVARRIRGAVRPEDSLARLGGDEFVVVCPRLADLQDARAVAERVRATLDSPVSIEGRAHRLSMSVGISAAPARTVDPAELLRQADMAMYRAKSAGRNTVRVHSVEMDDELAEAERIREALALALGADPDAVALVADPTGSGGDAHPSGEAGLVLHYQPVVDIGTGQLCYVEALARLRERTGRLVYPSQFLPVAARAGLNGALSERVLREALCQRTAWRAEGVDVPVGLNLAPGQVFSAGFAGEALRLIAEEGHTPTDVVFEMDEFGLLEATGPAQLTLRRLKSSGIGLAIDHFGTGYSSLGALRFLGPHRVKIDRSFVRSIASSSADRAIVTAAIGAAHALGQRVVAEGVESRQQLEVLADLGCDEAQGYLVARVLPADELNLSASRWAPGTLALLA